ncbi:MAG: cyclopropane-fatty-acyl-phospholipid synthase family protein [Anaerolineaceae bacterium]
MKNTMSTSVEQVVEPAVEQATALLERIFPQPRDFSIRLWDQTELPAQAKPIFTLILTHPGALRRMFTPPLELSFGEAYIYGDIDVEGDIFAMFDLAMMLGNRHFSATEVANLLREIQRLPNTGPRRTITRRPIELHGEVHSRQRDQAAVRFHYDVGNEFYSLWLDHNMQYSCAYFPEGTESLDVAQEKKMRHIYRKLRLKPGECLLDIGCGWGGLAINAAQQYGVEVLGVTLSEKQANYAQAWIKKLGLEDRVHVEMRDYRDLENASFDKVVSVGMFEHVGRTHLPEYFTQVSRLLKPGGLFLNHGIARSGQPDDLGLLKGLGGHPSALAAGQDYFERKVLGSGSFSQHYIFPDGELEPVSEVNLIAEAAGFEVRDVENLREHYALTLHQWVRRLDEHHAEAAKLVDETVYRTWRLYMSFSARQFETVQICINQSLLAKPRTGGKVDLPMSRADLYQ